MRSSFCCLVTRTPSLEAHLRPFPVLFCTNAADISPVPSEARRQSPVDLFIIFAGANIVATTLQVGDALTADFSPAAAVLLMIAGATAGSLLVAALAVLGPRLGVPSVIAARAALGVRGAALVAGLLYVTNFAWIAVNNVIAASVGARILGGPGSNAVWVLGLGLVSTSGSRYTVCPLADSSWMMPLIFRLCVDCIGNTSLPSLRVTSASGEVQPERLAIFSSWPIIFSLAKALLRTSFLIRASSAEALSRIWPFSSRMRSASRSICPGTSRSPAKDRR